MDEKIIRPYVRPPCGNVVRVYGLTGDQGMLLRWMHIDSWLMVDACLGPDGAEALSLQVWS